MRYKRLKSPLSVQIEITQRCNNRCFHCYNFWNQPHLDQRAGQTLTQQQLAKLMGILSDHEVLQVTLTGGEPLLYPSLVLLGVRTAVLSGIEVTVNSNLTRLDEDTALALRRVGLRSFLTSIAGPNAAVHDAVVGRSGAFDEAIRGIRIAKDCGYKVAANMVTTTTNQDTVRETGATLANLGVNTFAVTKATAPSSAAGFRGKYALSRRKVTAEHT